jgi:hypothetical protein
VTRRRGKLRKPHLLVTLLGSDREYTRARARFRQNLARTAEALQETYPKQH